MHTHRTASQPAAATTTKPVVPVVPVVTVDRVTEAHLAQFPTLPAGGYVVAVYRDGALDLMPQYAAEDAALIPWLHTGARQAATHHGWGHHLGCPWCGVNNCGTRGEHERLARMSETTWRECAA